MPREIERKFLVKEGDWRQADGLLYCQGYLNSHKERTVRVRIAGKSTYLTIKGLTEGFTRREYEYPVSLKDAEELMELCEKPLISKFRRKIKYQGWVWVVDEFTGENEGLIVAEIELKSEDDDFSRPPWLGDEVTHDPRYYNSNLVKYPYSFWKPPED